MPPTDDLFGGQRVDADGKQWHLRHLTSGDPLAETPHCDWCGLFIDVYGYFATPYGCHEIGLHEDCLERRNTHIAYMRDETQQRDDRHGDPKGQLTGDPVAASRPGR